MPRQHAAYTRPGNRTFKLSTRDPIVSVIVPVRDDNDGLLRLIDGLRVQTLSRDAFEVIVADDGSRDVGVDIPLAESWLKITRGPPLGSFAARNRGASLARGQVLAFTDADCQPAADWLERGLLALGAADLAAARVEPVLPERPTVWSLVDLGAWHDLEHLVRAGGAVTANLFVRRAWFERAGGFDATLPSGGDFDFASRCFKNGARGVFAHDAVVFHPTESSVRRMLRRVWFRNVWGGFRYVRAGERPERTKLRYLLPGMNLWRRHRLGLSLGLERSRLERYGVSLSRTAEIRACVARDLIISYWISAAQLRGAGLAWRTKSLGGDTNVPPPSGTER